MSDTKQARPSAELEHEIMDPNAPKNEREHWAASEIDRLRAERDRLTAAIDHLRADRDHWREAYRTAVNAGDIIVEQRNAFRTAVDQLCAERDRQREFRPCFIKGCRYEQ